ncbi:MAG: glutamine-hydrolyzing carbamoyl-phosphate synthase small subunit [Rhodanobacteraceae bacterium]|nr:glutamine-hydrolyzing carbamoyl-phosphate synthase small subunit [Xanthomonadales bacterium]MCP5478371.1 glutamine-hydrolyzing carbamoyl-phosphate synthase small subunit [Rhodanobacteraceae bacterium]HPF73598.1 glutamine-hydrolyzing carbamoyl-phosphate synthase small subunit [Xanthomonadaceae bacterium]HRX99325.1 glutamine-hydrolyzing carbamoyl-phosphate synthase small subunit [Xanthomonadaceae bacterium]
MTPALLALADGSLFHGLSVGADGESVGEVVFNTAMTGYQEILTDPSYARQLVTLTYPHIGNTGCNDADNESGEVYAAGLIVRDVPRHASSWRSEVDLPLWLRRRGVVAIAEIDTRRLTRILRDDGAQGGCLVAGENIDADRAVELARKFGSLKDQDLARVVSCRSSYQWSEGVFDLDANAFASGEKRFRVVAYDFGVKRNILRLLADRGCDVHVVPAQTPAADVMAMKPDGVFLSNGPGDPEPCDYAIAAIREFLDARMPLFGICLGHQLLGLASGAKTEKMKFGHHGANHPVQDLASGRVMITSQNHGFAVDETTLPANVQPSHRSLFDGSLQGIRFTDRPAFGFQGHPEASPGPQDIQGLFDQFTELMQSHRGKEAG